MSKQQMPTAQETRIRERRFAAIEQLVDMDTLYLRKNRFNSAHSYARELDISTVASGYTLAKMADMGILEAIKVMNGSNSGKECHYSRKPKSQLSTPWRKHPNFHPMPSRWQLGAPL